jgi:hypothetical protein
MTIFIICIFSTGMIKLKDYVMDGACSTHGEMRNAYTVLIRKTEETRPLGRLKHRWENSLETGLREITW